MFHHTRTYESKRRGRHTHRQRRGLGLYIPTVEELRRRRLVRGVSFFEEAIRSLPRRMLMEIVRKSLAAGARVISRAQERGDVRIGRKGDVVKA